MSKYKEALVLSAVQGFISASNCHNSTWENYWLGVLEYRLRVEE
jgi:hypothetical protein